MTDRQSSPAISSNWFFVLVSLLTLVTFVVAQSVYEVLSSNQDFLAVRQVGNLQLLQIVLVFNLLPALALFLLWTLCRRLHRSLARLFLAAVYLVFFLAFFLQIHNAYLSDWQPFPHAYLLWTGPAALLGFISLRFEKSFRSFLLALAPAVLIFPTLFLIRTWTDTQELLTKASPAVRQTVSQADKKQFPPIFLLVFDEFTLHAILDDTGHIDGSLFPNFKKLASESYWFRNTTANASSTTGSIPVILTGNFPLHASPSYEAYPNNIFTLLQPHYEIYIHEAITHFCVPSLFHCPDTEVATSRIGLLRDIFFLYAVRTLPEEIDAGLPDMTRTWGPFRGVREEMTARVERFQRFVNSLDSKKKENVFHYFHHLLPHAPFAVTSDGRIHERNWTFSSLLTPVRRALTDETIDQLYIAAKDARNTSILETLRDSYLMQVAYVDKEFGSFVTRLKRLGLYDKALIIMTSDHGVSYKPELPGRWLARTNADMILTVPLFIKVPFQKKGVVTDKDVQLIDIVPTITDVLGLRVPWEHIGRSAFDPGEEARKKIVYDKLGNRYEFPKNLGLVRVNVQPNSKLSPLIGKEIETFAIDSNKTAKGALDPLPITHFRERGDNIEFPIYVRGWAALPGESSIPNQIAVAVNGKIVAVTSPCCARPDVAKYYGNPAILQSGWVATFSSKQLQGGANAITAYVILDPRRQILAPVGRKTGRVIYRSPSGAPEPAQLLGERIEAFDIQKYKKLKGGLETLSKSRLRRKSGGDGSPIYVYGWAALVDKSTIPDQIAVAVNGEIVAVTSPCCDRPDVAEHFQNQKYLRSGWRASFSSQKLREGENTVRAYVVLDFDARKLAILNARQNTIQVNRR